MKQCLVVAPIGAGESYKTNLHRYEHIVKRAIETFTSDGRQIYTCTRSDLLTKSGSITKDLFEMLLNADLVVVDITELNPNVFYELGIRHALNRGTLLLAPRGLEPPFDIKDLRLIFYGHGKEGEEDAITGIQGALKSLIKFDDTIDSPVWLALPQLSETLLEKSSIHELRARAFSLQVAEGSLRTKVAWLERMNTDHITRLEHLRNKLHGGRDIEKQVEEWSRACDRAPFDLSSAKERRGKHQPNLVVPIIPESANKALLLTSIERTVAEAEPQLTCPASSQPLSIDTVFGGLIDEISRAGLLILDLTNSDPLVFFLMDIADELLIARIYIGETAQRGFVGVRPTLDRVVDGVVVPDLQYLHYRATEQGMAEFEERLRRVLGEYERSHEL